MSRLQYATAAPVESFDQSDRKGGIGPFKPDLRRANAAGSGEAQRGDLDGFDRLLVVNRSELGKPERLAILDIGLWTCAAGTTRAGKRLHVLGGYILALLIGSGNGGDGFEIDQTRDGVGCAAPNDFGIHGLSPIARRGSLPSQIQLIYGRCQRQPHQHPACGRDAKFALLPLNKRSLPGSVIAAGLFLHGWF